MSDRVRHILNISGGKDSSALAIFMKDKIAEMEYVFCDTGCELPETYEYLDKLESYLGKPIVRLNSGKTFDYWLEVYSNYLPSARSRWCTRVMKIEPFEEYVGDDEIISYVGIRADEDREGYISSRPNITPVYPFKDAGIVRRDVFEMLEKSGLGVPKYYEWRTRSGCYFCFFQRRKEWVGLLENHPDLFYKAKTYEQEDLETGKRFTWIPSKTLDEIERDKEQIKHKESQSSSKRPQSLFQSFRDLAPSGFEPDEPDDEACLICHL